MSAPRKQGPEGGNAATRRDVLARGAVLAGAAAVPAALLAAAPAHAQKDDQTGALENVINFERAARYAYTEAAAGERLSGDARALAEELAGQEDDHATALETALEQLGIEPPEESDPPPTDSAPILESFDPEASQEELIDFFIALEEEILQIYATAVASLTADDLLRSAAQIGGSHAQHLAAWRLLRGDAPAQAAALPGSESASEEE
jgi:rubrerythrin